MNDAAPPPASNADKSAPTADPEVDCTSGAESGNYDKRWAEHEARELVLIKRTKDFIVQVTTAYVIDWETTAEYDARFESDHRYDEERHGALFARLAYAEEIPLDGFDCGIRRGYLTMLGHAHVFLIELRYSACESMIVSARDFIQLRRTELSRSWFVTGTMRAAAAPVVLGFALALLRKQVIPFLGQESLCLLLATCAGAMGAFFSIMRRLGRFEFDLFASRLLHNQEAAGRIAVGCISALTVALAVQAHIISGAWVSGDRPLLALLAVAIIAGTSEQLVSSVIDGVQSGTRSKHPPEEHGTGAGKRPRRGAGRN